MGGPGSGRYSKGSTHAPNHFRQALAALDFDDPDSISKWSTELLKAQGSGRVSPQFGAEQRRLFAHAQRQHLLAGRARALAPAGDDDDDDGKRPDA